LTRVTMGDNSSIIQDPSPTIFRCVNWRQGPLLFIDVKVYCIRVYSINIDHNYNT